MGAGLRRSFVGGGAGLRRSFVGGGAGLRRSKTGGKRTRKSSTRRQKKSKTSRRSKTRRMKKKGGNSYRKGDCVKIGITGDRYEVVGYDGNANIPGNNRTLQIRHLKSGKYTVAFERELRRCVVPPIWPKR
uniref:Uncharacterized protein n=1 Tax=viral metagenome TaxID=1070528 RepID=A0A6C0BS34_9ZZZZ